MIEAQGLTKRYGDKTAVADLSFTVQPGLVTGFLGPNGAGKSTTMRMILGLDEPTEGHVLVNGKPYRDHRTPLAQVGALLEAKAVHTSRSAYNHLRAQAATHRIPDWRVQEVIDMVGLNSGARKRVGGFSLGMGQRLGIASAMLADPQILILDEPVNGLDPEGIRWVRELLRDFAGRGRTVFLSSHLMSEMELTADHVIIVGRGRKIADVAIEDLRRSAAVDRVLIRTPDADRLRTVLAGPQVTISSTAPDLLEVSGLPVELIGQTALDNRILLHELTPQRASLEQTFMNMTHDSVEYVSTEAVAA